MHRPTPSAKRQAYYFVADIQPHAFGHSCPLLESENHSHLAPANKVSLKIEYIPIILISTLAILTLCLSPKYIISLSLTK